MQPRTEIPSYLFLRFVLLLLLRRDDSAPSHSCHALDGGTSQIRTYNGWKAIEIITQGESKGDSGWTMPPYFDGAGAYIVNARSNNPIIRIHLNHENDNDSSISEINLFQQQTKQAINNMIRTNQVGDVQFVRDARLAYDRWTTDGGMTIRTDVDPDRTGFCRFCSSQEYQPNTFGLNRGFVDQLYITGEECTGGALFALDSQQRILYQVSGYAGSSSIISEKGGIPFDPWENAALIDTGETRHVALLLVPDVQGSRNFLQLYIGHKGKSTDGADASDFLSRNGLAYGEYFLLRSSWPDTGNTNDGESIVKDESGVLGNIKLEDADTCPYDPTKVVIAETHQGLYVVDFDLHFDNSAAGGGFDSDSSSFSITKIPTNDIRFPDNVEWSANGHIFVNEDNKRGAIWYQDEDGGSRTKIGETIGVGESAGIFDLSDLLDYDPGLIMVTSFMGSPASLTILINPVLVRQTFLPEGSSIYEAEDADIFWLATVRTTHQGYSGDGYIDMRGQGGYVEWTIELIDSGPYSVSVTYAAAGSARPAKLYVDEVLVAAFVFESTSSWDDWNIESTVLDLETGIHVFKISADQSDGPNLDWLALGLVPPTPSPSGGPTSNPTMSVSPSASVGPTAKLGLYLDGSVPKPAGATIYEAEDGMIVHATIETNNVGYSGYGYVDMLGRGASVEWLVADGDLDEGYYELAVAYASTSNRPATLITNEGSTVGYFAFQATSSWRDWSMESHVFFLGAEVEMLKLSADQSSGPNIDWLALRYLASGVEAGNVGPLVVRFEAEDAVCELCRIESRFEGYTGIGYIDFLGFDAFAEWTLQIPRNGIYEVAIRYATDPDRPADLYIDTNGRRFDLDFRRSGGWSSWKTEKLGDIFLIEGDHVFKIDCGQKSSCPNVDWIEVRTRNLRRLHEETSRKALVHGSNSCR